MNLSNRGTDYQLVDIEGDGDLDIATVSYGLGVEILINTGDGEIHTGERFDGPFRYSTGQISPTQLLLGDLDGDGDLDAVSENDPFTKQPYDDYVALLQIPGTPPDGGGGDVDLTVGSVAPDPAPVTAGEPLAVEYTVTNEGADAAVGPWTDAVYLSADDTWDVNDRPLVTVDRNEPLLAGTSYTETVDVVAHPAVAGENQIIVRTDARNALTETDEADNQATTPVDVVVPVIDGSLDVTVGAGEVAYAQVAVEEAEQLLLTVSGPSDGATVDVVRDAIPVPRRQLQVPDRSETVRRLGLPAGDAGTWFIRLAGDAGLAGDATFTLTVASLDFGIVSIEPSIVADNGPATVVLTGAGFTDDTVVALDGPASIEAESVAASEDGRSIAATFDWGPLSDSEFDVPIGRYDVVVTDGEDTDTLTNGLRVIEAESPAAPETRAGRMNPCFLTGEEGGRHGEECAVFAWVANVPGELRRLAGTAGTPGYFLYQNRARIDIPRPFVEIYNKGVEISTDGGLTWTQGGFELPVPNLGAADDVLPAGISGRIDFRIRSTDAELDDGIRLVNDYRVGHQVYAPFDYSGLRLNAGVREFERILGEGTPEVKAVADSYLAQLQGPGRDLEYWTPDQYGRTFLVDYPVRCPNLVASSGGGRRRIRCYDLRPRAHAAVLGLRTTTPHDYLMEAHDQIAAARSSGYDGPFARAFAEGLFRARALATAPGAPVSGEVTVDGVPLPMPPVLSRVDSGDEGDDYAAGFGWIDGSYNLWDVPPGEDMEIWVDGHVPDPAATATVPAEGTEIVDLAVSVGNTISGIVSIDGVPVADALVTTTTDSGAERRDLTDEDGAYVLTGLGTGARDVLVEHERAVGETRSVDVGDGDNDEDFDLVGRGAVAGTVRSAGGGTLVGAEVRVVPADAPEGIDLDQVAGLELASTDASGGYVIPGLDPGDYVVFATAAGHVDGSATVTVSSATEAVDLSLAVAARIEGTVLDSRGDPATSAGVFVRVGEDQDVVAETLTGEDGAFFLDGLEAGAVNVMALDTSFGTATEDLDLVAGETTALDLAFPPTQDVPVRVVDESGAPVGVVRVDLLGPDPDRQSLASGSTEPDGTLVFDDVVAGGAVIVVGGLTEVSVPADHDGVTPIEVVVSTATVSGTLLDRSDDPLADQPVHLVRDGEVVTTTRSDDDGAFIFEVAQAGDYEVVSAPGRDGLRRQAFAVTPPADLDLGVVERGPNSLTLTTDLDEEELLAFHEVQLLLPGIVDPRLYLTDLVTTDESVVFDGLDADDYELVALNAARYARGVVTVDGDETAPLSDNDVGFLEGTVLDSAGAPVPDAVLNVVAPDAAPVTDVAEEDGAYLTPLAPGTYDVLVRAPSIDESVRLEGVVVAEGATTALDPQTAPGGADIDVAFADAVPSVFAIGSHVSLADSDTGVHIEAYDGAAVFAGLPPGDYEVQVRVPGRAPWSMAVTLGTDDVAVEADLGTALAMAPPAPSSVDNTGAPAGAGAADGFAAARAPDHLAGGWDAPEHLGTPEFQSGIAAYAGGFLESLFVGKFQTAYEYIKQELQTPPPERDPAEEELRERLEHLQRKLNARKDRDVGICRTTLTSYSASIQWDDRKERFFEAWVDRQKDLKRAVDDIIETTFLAFVSMALLLVSLTGVVLLAIPILEGTAVAGTLATISGLFGEAALFGLTVPQLAGLTSFVTGIIPAAGAAMDEVIRRAESLDGKEIFNQFATLIVDLIGAVWGILTQPLNVFGYSWEPFALSTTFFGMGTLLSDEASNYFAFADKEIDRIVKDASLSDLEARDVALKRSALIEDNKRLQRRFNVSQGEISEGRQAYLESNLQRQIRNGDEIVELTKQLDEVNLTPEQASRIAQLRELPPASGLRAIGEILSTVGGAFLDLVSYVQAAEAQLEAIRGLDEQLANGKDRYDTAERAYKAAINNSKLEVERSTHSLLRPECNDPIDPEDWDDVIDGYYIAPKDPNEIVGPLGGGDEHALVATPPSLDYAIFFENLGPGSEEIPDGEEIAEVSAARVTIGTELDADVDSDAVTLGDIQIGEIVIDVPDGLSAYEGVHGPYPDPGGEAGDIQIRVEGSVVDGMIRWVLTALEPGTGFVVGDLRGILPPEDGSGLGKGSVGYSVAPGMGAGNGTVVTAQASIVFDDNDAIVTNTWSNVFDDDIPEATLVDTPETGDLPFELTWTSSDPTSSVTDVDVYLRYDDDWLRVKRVTGADSTTITGDDLTFGFEPEGIELPEGAELVANDSEVDVAVVAIDAAGNSELAPPAESEASVLLGTGFDAGPSPEPEPEPPARPAVDADDYPAGPSRADQVRRLYLAAFGRHADDAGLRYWVNSGLSMLRIAEEFVRSSEFRARFGAPSASGYVAQLYRNILGRAGDISGTSYWILQLSTGMSRAAVLLAFAESQELIARLLRLAPDGLTEHRSDRVFRLYRAALGRAPDTAGWRYWAETDLTIQQIAGYLADSSEYRARYGNTSDLAFVELLYRNILGRRGEQSGIAYWVALLTSGIPRAAVVVGFSDSEELRTRIARGVI